MRALALAMFISLFAGCYSLNSEQPAPTSNKNMKKDCGCNLGVACCSRDREGHLCCKPGDCSCDQVTSNITTGGCCK